MTGWLSVDFKTDINRLLEVYRAEDMVKRKMPDASNIKFIFAEVPHKLKDCALHIDCRTGDEKDPKFFTSIIVLPMTVVSEEYSMKFLGALHQAVDRFKEVKLHEQEDFANAVQWR